MYLLTDEKLNNLPEFKARHQEHRVVRNDPEFPSVVSVQEKPSFLKSIVRYPSTVLEHRPSDQTIHLVQPSCACVAQKTPKPQMVKR